MRSWLPSLGFAAFLALAGCASVPVASIVPLMQLDLASTSIEDLRVALQLPDGLRSQPGGVTLDLVLKREGSADLNEQFRLVDTEGASDIAGLVPRQKPGYRLSAYRLAREDVPRFRSVQTALAEATRQRIRGSLGFGIAAREFCLAGQGMPSRLLASTYLMTTESNGWLTVTDGFDLASDPRIAAGLSTLRPC